MKMNKLFYKLFLFFLLFHTLTKNVWIQSLSFDVMKLSNVPFPSSSVEPVYFNAPYHKNISEFTICYRFQIESYNDGLFWLIGAKKEGSFYNWIMLDRMGWDTGNEMDGYQSGTFIMGQNVPGGGLGPDNYPVFKVYMLATNIYPAQWQNICYSYSSSLQKIHMYQNGAFVFSFHFKDDKKHNPLPSNSFGRVILGRNFRGLFTDLHIYDKFSDEAMLGQLSTNCKRKKGEIFSWDSNKIKITEVFRGECLSCCWSVSPSV